MTTSVTQCEAMLNQILNERANVLAKETGFVKRERKLTGATIVRVMALGHLHQPEAPLEQLTQDAQVYGVQISASGLHQRCTQQAATFLQAVLVELVEQVVTVNAVPIALFKRFEQVIIEDATTIVLPAALATSGRDVAEAARTRWSPLPLRSSCMYAWISSTDSSSAHICLLGVCMNCTGSFESERSRRGACM